MKKLIAARWVRSDRRAEHARRGGPGRAADAVGFVTPPARAVRGRRRDLQVSRGELVAIVGANGAGRAPSASCSLVRSSIVGDIERDGRVA